MAESRSWPAHVSAVHACDWLERGPKRLVLHNLVCVPCEVHVSLGGGSNSSSDPDLFMTGPRVGGLRSSHSQGCRQPGGARSRPRLIKLICGDLSNDSAVPLRITAIIHERGTFQTAPLSHGPLSGPSSGAFLCSSELLASLQCFGDPVRVAGSAERTPCSMSTVLSLLRKCLSNRWER